MSGRKTDTASIRRKKEDSRGGLNTKNRELLPIMETIAFLAMHADARDGRTPMMLLPLLLAPERTLHVRKRSPSRLTTLLSSRMKGGGRRQAPVAVAGARMSRAAASQTKWKRRTCGGSLDGLSIPISNSISSDQTSRTQPANRLVKL